MECILVDIQRRVFGWHSSFSPLFSFYFFPSSSYLLTSFPPLFFSGTHCNSTLTGFQSLSFSIFPLKHLFTALNKSVFVFQFPLFTIKVCHGFVPITLGLLVTVFAEIIFSTVAMILCFVLAKNKRKITSTEISWLHH